MIGAGGADLAGRQLADDQDGDEAGHPGDHPQRDDVEAHRPPCGRRHGPALLLDDDDLVAEGFDVGEHGVGRRTGCRSHGQDRRHLAEVWIGVEHALREDDRARRVLEVSRVVDDTDHGGFEGRALRWHARLELVVLDLLHAVRGDGQSVAHPDTELFTDRSVDGQLVRRRRVGEPTLHHAATERLVVAGERVELDRQVVGGDLREGRDERERPDLSDRWQLADQRSHRRSEGLQERQLRIAAEGVGVPVGGAARALGAGGQGEDGPADDAGQHGGDDRAAPSVAGPSPNAQRDAVHPVSEREGAGPGQWCQPTPVGRATTDARSRIRDRSAAR